MPLTEAHWDEQLAFVQGRGSQNVRFGSSGISCCKVIREWKDTEGPNGKQRAPSKKFKLCGLTCLPCTVCSGYCFDAGSQRAVNVRQGPLLGKATEKLGSVGVTSPGSSGSRQERGPPEALHWAALSGHRPIMEPGTQGWGQGEPSV